MNALRTTTSCTECGEEIPESLLSDALCVRCRYPSTGKKPAPDGPSEYEIALEQYAAVSQPNEPAAPGDGPDLETILGWLSFGQADAKTIGGRVLMLAFMFPLVPGRPVSLRELGARLGCSHTSARRMCSSLRAHFVRERRKIEARSFQPDS